MNHQQGITLPGAGVTVERNVPLAMADGVVLMADIYRPPSDEPLPVILIRIPYDKTQSENALFAHPSWYARQGYIVVCQDTRGRYASDGEFYPFRDETDDGFETIAWAAALPGSNGKVGMYGCSYGGATQLLPARRRPPALGAICPVMTGSQYYEGWTYNQGALALGFAASWALSLGSGNALKRGDIAAAAAYQAAFAGALNWHWVLPLDAYPPLTGEDTPYFFDWLDHPTYDDYWRQWSIDESYDQFDVPGLHVAGWYDVFLDGTIRNFHGLRQSSASAANRRNQKLIIGPWFHIPWKPLAGAPDSAAAPNLVDDWQIAWFDQFLKGKENGILDSPVTVMLIGESTWREYGEWPPKQSVPLKWHLHSGGRANSKYGDGWLDTVPAASEPGDCFTYDPSIPSLSAGGHSCCFPFVAPMGPADQESLEQWNSVVVYTSAPLANDLYLAGDAEAVLYAATSALDTDWTVRISKVDQHGGSMNLQEGIQRARFRQSLSEPSLLEPHRVYEYRIPIGAIGARFRQGERIRVVIGSSDFPQWDRNLNSGGETGRETIAAAKVATQMILHDADHPSHILLPTLAEG